MTIPTLLEYSHFVGFIFDHPNNATTPWVEQLAQKLEMVGARTIFAFTQS